MWRAGFLALASCSLISTSVQASGPTGPSAGPRSSSGSSGAARPEDPPVDPESTIPLGAYDKVPAQMPATVSPPDVPAPAIVTSKGPFSQRGSHVGGLNAFLPVSREPASPWTGVSKGQPVKVAFRHDRWWIRDESLACTAALDHCLPAYSWFWVRDEVTDAALRSAHPIVFTTDGPRRPGPVHDIDEQPFVAYRSVPATKKNLVGGARVFVFPDTPIPTGTDGVYDGWMMGVVDRVDWDLGFVFVKNIERPFFVTAARVGVLGWDKASGVHILDGKKRDEIAIRAADVIVP